MNEEITIINSLLSSSWKLELEYKTDTSPSDSDFIYITAYKGERKVGIKCKAYLYELNKALDAVYRQCNNQPDIIATDIP